MTKPKTTQYPATHRGDHVDNYHGTAVPDPYRWLEDPDSAETVAWVEAQNALTRPFLDALPHREQIKARTTQLWDFPKVGTPWKQGKRYFWYANSGLQNQSVLFVASRPDSKTPRVLLDPNLLSKDGTVALSSISLTEDASLMAFSTSASGSDWQEWRVLDVATGKELPDVIRWCKFTGAQWTRDNKGFYYSRYAEPRDDGKGKHEDANENQKVYYHLLGKPQSEDKLIYERPDQPQLSFGAFMTDDGRFLCINASQGFDGNHFLVKDLTKPGSDFVELFEKADAHYDYVWNVGSVMYFKTDLDAPRSRLVALDVSTFTGGTPQFQLVIPQSTDTLESVQVLDGKFVTSYLKDAHTQVRVFTRAGTHVRDVDLPGLGTVGGFSGTPRQWVTYYSFTSFNTPGATYRYNLRTGNSELFRETKVAFDTNDYVTEQVFYTSKDGTKVPMFISYRKGLKKDGQNPTYLYGYGGFNINLTPSFSTSLLVWMEMGGVFAQPNLRGGGEYGEEWHQGGAKHNKQNVFDDFIGAAEWLIANGYTSTPKLAIGGGSNGGLLVGACMTQRPELYAAAFPAVGVLDMLRFHKFTIGFHWVSEYGSADEAADFNVLHAYSPLHNVKPGTKYPATMVSTADHDDRVVPAHSYKFISELQAGHAGETPVLIRIESKAGHGAGKPTAKVIEEVADKWAFALAALGATPLAK